MRLLRFALVVLIAAIVLAAAGGGAYLWFLRSVAAPGPLAAPATVLIQPGTGLKGIARQLAANQVIAAPWLFEAEARRTGQARALKPGEYRFEAGISIDNAIGKIVRREVVAHFVTIPEGLVTAEVLRILGAAEGLQGAVSEPVHDGDLLPETYRYEWGDARAGVVARMRQARDAALAEAWAKRRADLPLKTPAEALVLASIVEKETGIAAERPKVAAVFLNRLRHGMRLQSDPTVSYGLAPEGLNRPLTHADLERPGAYNTYAIDGLPPAPICNPGRASIAAAVEPADSDDLYFVADGSGGHVFAATLEAHNRNVAHWRQLRRDRAADLQP